MNVKVFTRESEGDETRLIFGLRITLETFQLLLALTALMLQIYDFNQKCGHAGRGRQ